MTLVRSPGMYITYAIAPLFLMVILASLSAWIEITADASQGNVAMDRWLSLIGLPTPPLDLDEYISLPIIHIHGYPQISMDLSEYRKKGMQGSGGKGGQGLLQERTFQSQI